jgi:hypothetical protein
MNTGAILMTATSNIITTSTATEMSIYPSPRVDLSRLRSFFILASLSEQNTHVAYKLPAEYYNIEQHHAHHQEERQPVNFWRYLQRNAAEVLAL